MDSDQKYMKEALDEAEKGRYHNWKDALTGAVIVKDDAVLATGYHHGYQEAHAVQEAISSAANRDLAGATLYLNLEPCGKCVNLIKQNKIDRVVIAQEDPNKVKGQSVKALKAAGIEVKEGVLAEEAKKLNQFYNYFFEKHSPWITIKESFSFDHRVSSANGQRGFLTNDAIHRYIHHERADYQALLIGSSTVITDNPNMLTDVDSKYQPIRVVLDRRGRLLNHPGVNLLNNENVETWIFTQNDNVKNMKLNPRVKVFQLKSDKLSDLINTFTEKGIQSLYVEGGPTLQKSFIDDLKINKIVNYLAPVYLGDIGVEAAVPTHHLELTNMTVKKIQDNIRIAGEVKQDKKD